MIAGVWAAINLKCLVIQQSLSKIEVGYPSESKIKGYI